jgi:hypothetical protein
MTGTVKLSGMEFPVAAQEDVDGLLLGLQLQPATALARGGYAEIRNIRPGFHGQKNSKNGKEYKLQTLVCSLFPLNLPMMKHGCKHWFDGLFTVFPVFR